MSERLRQTELRKQNAALAQRADELGRSKAAADATSRAKADLLASMSHELRTPLNGIIGLTELVLGSRLTASQREYLGLVRDSGESLLALINDILDMSKIEAGRMEFDSQPFRLRDRLVETLKTVAVRAHRKGVELACRVAPAVPDHLRGDLLRIRQVVINLVGNAVKFTERGEIVVEVTCPERAAEHVTLQFTVRDTGMGIPMEKLAMLFQPYSQADAAIARDYGGTGLGLSISAGLVQGMNGRIWAESKVGLGSAFHFTVPLEIEPGDIAPLPSLAGKRVLLIQPHATTAQILQETLQGWGLDAKVFMSVAEATCEAAAALAGAQPYSHLLSDSRAPDALDRLQQLRASNNLAVLMLLSADQVNTAAQCDELQIPHLLKPIKPTELLNFLQAGCLTPQVLAASEAVAATRDATVASSGARILLAEDGLVNQKLAVSLLTRGGHQVTVAATGKEALAALDRERFDLVLMDVHMPEMDGLEATRAIRAREQQSKSRLPILAMTASSSLHDIQRCLTAGMDGFVAKPVRQALLQAAIEEQLSAARSGAGRTNGHVVDWPAALQHAGGQHEQLEERVTLLLQEVPRVRRELVAAAASKTHSELRIAAHTMKVALTAFGAPRIADLAEELEASSETVDSSTTDEVLARFLEESERLMAALQQFRGASSQ